MARSGLQIIEAPSPNHGPRRRGARPDMVVLHHTAMASAEAALARLRDPAAEVSAHYLIAEDGRVWRLVAEARRAWHAGRARWGAVADVNSRSIGIELANGGPLGADPPYAEPQMAALEALLAAVAARWGIGPARVVGHECVAPGRKADPGRKFDWRRLARRGLAVWADGAGPAAPGPAAFQLAARAFGYAAPETGAWDAETEAVLAAFQRRFRPQDLGRGHSAAGQGRLEALAARWPVVDSPPAGA